MSDKAVSKKGRNMSKETLILLYGGRSAEREVSVFISRIGDESC